MTLNHEKEKSSKPLSPTRRWGGLYTVGILLLLLLFFTIHQRRNTGFFTDKFGPVEMVALYFPIILSMAAPILRAAQGRVEPARLVEAISDVCLALGAIWLRNTFPFNFTHLADLFPTTVHFVLAWMNDGVGRLILLLQIIFGIISAFATFGGYLTERRRREEKVESG